MKANKGQTREMLDFAILVVSISVVFILFYLIIISPQKKTEQSIVNYHTYNRVLNAVNDFYYSKISGTQMNLPIFLADRIILNKTPVYYGEGYPNIDVDNMTTNFFNIYFDDRWQLEVPIKESKPFRLGHEKPRSTDIQSFELLLATPTINNEVIKGYLYVWTE